MGALDSIFPLLLLVTSLCTLANASDQHFRTLHRRVNIPATLPEGWKSQGCVLDVVNGAPRTLQGATTSGPNMTIETCIEFCDGSNSFFAGVEFGDECYCGNVVQPTGTNTSISDCNVPCTGNSNEPCGAGNRLNLFWNGKTPPPPPPISLPVLTDDLPVGWAYNACWVDNAHGRIFIQAQPGDESLTIQSCINQCQALNLTVAGTEFSDECFCGDNIVNGGTIAADQTTCNNACSGDATQACGGPDRLSVYSSVPIEAFPVPIVLRDNLPGKWEYAGCLSETATGKMFANKMDQWTFNNSALACMNQCAAFGYSAAGVEFGDECYCGDTIDVKNNHGQFVNESECTMPCPGDPTFLCGAGNRLNTYFWDGPDGTANIWHTPSNKGRYEFFVPGLVVPLIATLGINNKVTFLEKGGTGIPNATGAYELDLSLSSNFSAMWREMHIKTDVFCSGSVIMPDKAGRQINVAGWAEESNFGIRLYTPSGSPGVNGTTDWEENKARWYPTAAVLANGSILVMGGEIGSNAAPQPNLEILPKPAGGPTVVPLDWLARTDPNNLYPFIFVLPTKNIFVAYFNEARILDPVSFDTIISLPNMPGNVNNFEAGRTYPLEGAAVPFPQFAPYTDPFRVLICGGSTNGAGDANDNCVSISPEVPNATWTLERMPSKRVMPCMVSLPDGTFMIMNGAMQGVAGFGLANDPNLNAVLYDPTQPVGSRFSILNDTIVARMYHSEATLLPDGRILVSGSDPQTNFPNGTVKYPEEFRIEVYVPPYLNEGFTQPTFTLSKNDWAYGSVNDITNVKLFQGTTGQMRISLIAATSSTHGNTMGARTIFPAFSCTGSTCSITAPPHAGISPPGWHQLFILDGPTPSHSQWVRIGGDPAQLGNWPNLPGFTIPGV